MGVVAQPHALAAGAAEEHVADRDPGEVARLLGRADVDQPAVLHAVLDARLPGVDRAHVRGERDASQLLLPVDGEAVEGDPAVVDVDEASGAVQHGAVAPLPVRPGLRPLDDDRRPGGAVAHGGELLVVDAGREVDRRAGRRLLQGRLDRRQRRRRRPAVVAVAPVRADVERRLRCHRDRRGRHLPVRRLPVQDHHRGDREQGHDDRGHHRDHHGASRWGGTVPVRTLRRGGAHADEDFRSSATSRCSGSGRGATGGLSMRPAAGLSLGETPMRGRRATVARSGPWVYGGGFRRGGRPLTSPDSSGEAPGTAGRGGRTGGRFHSGVVSQTGTLHRVCRCATCIQSG